MISTGQVVPLSGLKGFSAKGYFPAVINEGLSNHQYYSLPVAGANSIALIYNIAMLKAANITPPKTWAELVSDAKALTTSDHYGIALTCEPAEDTTWQWEPFFWSNGGERHVLQHRVGAGGAGTEPVEPAHHRRFGVQGLPPVEPDSRRVDAVHRRQGRDDGQRALELPDDEPGQAVLRQAVRDRPVPVNKAGQHVVVPLGGEDWMVSKSGGSDAQQMAFEYIQGMQTPAHGAEAREAVRLSAAEARRGEAST